MPRVTSSRALLPPTPTAERPLGVGAALLTVFAAFMGGQLLGTAVAVLVAIAVAIAGGRGVSGALHNLESLTSHPGFVSLAAFTTGATLVFAAFVALRIARVPFRAGTAVLRPRPAHVLLALLLVFAAGPFADLAVRAFKAAFPNFTLGLLESIGDAARTDGPLLLVLLFSVSLVPGIAEELFFRGLIQRSLTARLGGPVGIALASFLFGAFHVDPPQAVGAAVLGVALGFVVWRTGNVVPAMAAHAGNNALALVYARQEVEPAPDLDLGTHAAVLGVSAVVLAVAAVLLVRATPRLAAPEIPA
jgi:membrane protease YdiL (CAAX protease family)